MNYKNNFFKSIDIIAKIEYNKVRKVMKVRKKGGEENGTCKSYNKRPNNYSKVY